MYTREACVFLCMNVCVRREGLQQNMVAWNLSLQQEREREREIGRERGTLYEDCKRKKLNNKDIIRQQYYRGKVLTDKKSKRKFIFRKSCVCKKKKKNHLWYHLVWEAVGSPQQVCIITTCVTLLMSAYAFQVFYVFEGTHRHL